MTPKSKKSPKKPTYSPLTSRKPPISPMVPPTKSPGKSPTKSPKKSPRDICTTFKTNPFLRTDWPDIKEMCKDLVINWNDLYPSNPTKQKLCSDFYTFPTRIPLIKEIPESERISLDDIGTLSRKLQEFCSGPEETLYRGKFKKTMALKGDIDVVYSRYKPVSRKEIINPLIMSDEVIRDIQSGNNLTILILLKYLENKHKNTCVVFGYPDAIKYTFDEREIHNSEIPSLDEPILARGENPDNFFAILPNTKDTSILLEPIKIHYDDNFIRMVNYCRKKYIVGLIEIENISNKKHTHSNAFIIDKSTKTFWVYEPDGFFDAYQHFYFKSLQTTLKDTFSADFTIVPFGGTCDIKGLQKLEKERGEEPIIDAVISDPGGYCAYYSTWILDMVLENPHISPDEIQQYAIRYIRKIKDFIRGFGVFINSILRDYEILLELNKSALRKNPYGKILLLNNIIDFYLDIDEE